MTSLIDKIELLIKREKTTPERKKKDEPAKSSSEILSELFGAFNAAPPKIEDIPVKKSKRSKKKHKKEKKKRSRSSSSSDSDDSEYSRKRKKRKKSKSKKRRSSIEQSPVLSINSTPPSVKVEPDLVKVKSEKTDTKVKLEHLKDEYRIKTEPRSEEKQRRVSIKSENDNNINISLDLIDASDIPLPDDIALDSNDLRRKLEGKKADESDKAKGKIQIKNLKFSAVFEETVKKAEEEARKKKEKTEEGEYTDSSSSSVREEDNSQFPKSSDPGGILKKQAEIIKISADDKSKRSKHSESSYKSSKKESSSSRRRSRSRSASRRHRSRSRDRRSRTPRRGHDRRERSRDRRERSRDRGDRSRDRGDRSRDRGDRERSRSRHRSSGRRSRSPRHRQMSPRHRGGRRSPTGVKLADSEKKRLLEVARRNAINMLKNGAVPAGAAALPIHTRNQVMAAIQSGGKSVDELTDFCKHLSKKEALGELSSCSSNGEDMSENEDTLAFHHPFLVKEKAPIVMNIRGGAPLPVKNALLPVANKEELRIQFPVSSGSQHRHKSTEWVPVSPKKDSTSTQVAKLNTKPSHKPTTAPTEKEIQKPPPFTLPAPLAPLALPAPPAPPAAPGPVPAPAPVSHLFAPSSQLSVTSLPALTAPGPQAYPPGKEMPKKIDISSIVSEKIAMIRARSEKEHEFSHGFGWSSTTPRERPGQFTGSTGARILTPSELASGTQAWAKRLGRRRSPLEFTRRRRRLIRGQNS